MPPLRLRDFLLAPRDRFVVARHVHADRGAPPPLHTHTFPELFWVEAGSGWHLLPGGRRRLEAGTMCFVAAADSHSFAGDAAAPLTMVNVAFPPASWAFLRRRYPELAPWFAGPAELRERRLPPEALAALAARGRELMAGPRSRLALESFLLDLARLPAAPAPARGEEPAWLRHARHEVRSPRWFRLGAPGFARLCGRSPEHVAREVRRWHGCTPTTLVTQARLAWAAVRLAEGGGTILDVALDAGFPNLGHFYQCFRRRHGTTPRRWRLRAQRLAGAG